VTVYQVHVKVVRPNTIFQYSLGPIYASAEIARAHAEHSYKITSGSKEVDFQWHDFTTCDLPLDDDYTIAYMVSPIDITDQMPS